MSAAACAIAVENGAVSVYVPLSVTLTRLRYFSLSFFGTTPTNFVYFLAM